LLLTVGQRRREPFSRWLEFYYEWLPYEQQLLPLTENTISFNTKTSKFRKHSQFGSIQIKAITCARRQEDTRRATKDLMSSEKKIKSFEEGENEEFGIRKPCHLSILKLKFESIKPLTIEFQCAILKSWRKRERKAETSQNEKWKIDSYNKRVVKKKKRSDLWWMSH